MPIPSHSIWSQARRSTDFCFFRAGIKHISVFRPSQSPGVAVRCASASALECEHAPPSQSILGTQDVQTGTSMKPLPQQGGDWHCHTWSKRAVSLACWRCCCWRARSCLTQIELRCSTPVVDFFFFFFLSSCRKLRALVTRNREIKNSGLM